MCMYVKNTAKIRRTFKSIPCWKAVEISEDGYMSPYAGNRIIYRVGKTAKMGIRETLLIYKNGTCCKVESGLHTFCDINAALTEAAWLGSVTYRKFTVLECRIPKFARFVKGIDSRGNNNYVSDRLKVIRII